MTTSSTSASLVASALWPSRSSITPTLRTGSGSCGSVERAGSSSDGGPVGAGEAEELVLHLGETTLGPGDLEERPHVGLDRDRCSPQLLPT